MATSPKVIPVANYAGPSTYSAPDINTIGSFLKSGQAKVVTVYPESYVNGGAWDVRYYDQPHGGTVYDYESGFVPTSGVEALEVDGKIYVPSNSWTFQPITKTVQTGTAVNEDGFPYPVYEQVKTGQYRVRTRADNNVFNEMIFQPEAGTGQITSYNPTVYQTGSNEGTGFLGSVQGLLNNPLVPVILAAALPGAGTAIGSALGLTGTAATIAGNTLIQTALNGGDAEKALISSVIGAGTNALGSAVSGGEDILNAGTADLQNVYGGELPIDQVATGIENILPEVATVGTGITTPEVTPTQIPNVTPSVTQPDYLAADAAATQDILKDPFAYTTEDLTNPLADTTATMPSVPEPVPEAVAQQPAVTEQPQLPPSPSDYLEADAAQTVANDVNSMSNIGMTEAEAQDQFYKDIGIDPASLSDLPPATTAEINQILQAGTTNVTASDVNKIKSLISTANTAKNLLSSTGLLGGAAGALAGAAAIGALTGGSSSTTPAPVSQAGTYSGTANYSPAYYQQIQQNYNRLFPTAPADITTPLQSWYATKFVPDTNISQKLFGV